MSLWPRKQEVSESPLVLLGFGLLESGKDKEGEVGITEPASCGVLFQLVGPRSLLGLEKGLGVWTSKAGLCPASCGPGPWLVHLSWGRKKALKLLIPGLHT